MKNKIKAGIALVLLFAASVFMVTSTTADTADLVAVSPSIDPQIEIMPLRGCFIYASVSLYGSASAKADSSHLNVRYSSDADRDSCWMKLEGTHAVVHPYEVRCWGSGNEKAYASARWNYLYTLADANTWCTCQIFRGKGHVAIADLPKNVRVTSSA